MARGPSKRNQRDSNPQPLNTHVSGGADSTTELSPGTSSSISTNASTSTINACTIDSTGTGTNTVIDATSQRVS